MWADLRRSLQSKKLIQAITPRALTTGRNQASIVVAVLLAGVAYPFVQPMIPAGLPLPTTNNLVVMTYFAVLAMGLNIVVGLAGLLDLGYVAFYVFGAYTAALLGSDHFGIHIPWLLVAPIAAAVAASAGALLGAPTLRLRGDYLAIVTLGFGQIIPEVVRNLGSVNIQVGSTYIIGPNTNLTGGVIGINPIDALVLPIAGPWGSDLVFSNANPQASFYLVLAMLVLCFVVCRRLRDGRLGLSWMAIREDETAAAMMGINTVTTKLLAFSLGASFAGFVGSFVASYQTAIFPESFNYTVSITILIMVVIGGMGSLTGAIVGAFTLEYVTQVLLPFLGRFTDPPIHDLGASVHVDLLASFSLVNMNYLIFGAILVMMMVLKPEGLLPSKTRRAELQNRGTKTHPGTVGEGGTVVRLEAEREWFAEGTTGLVDGLAVEQAATDDGHTDSSGRA